ncbi:hypothetical protein ScPMuIL_016864 [Solemya velum]
MGKSEETVQNGFTTKCKYFSMEEVKKHCKPDDKWIVIKNKVYDITNFAKKHPGGARIISHYAGQDATDAWWAFHDQKDYVGKFMKTVCIGEVTDLEETELQSDFRQLRSYVEKNNLLDPNPWFFIAHFAHIIALEILALCVFWYFGAGWGPYFVVVLILTTSQSQAGWTQHDYGHLSVFESNTWNHLFHHLTIGQLKGAASHWWNFRHNQHHAKPNVLKMDPDINLSNVFVLGKKIPVDWAKKKRGFMPYNLQHIYFFFFGPPLLLPVYFHLEILYFIIKRADYKDFLSVASFFLRHCYIYSFFLGGWGAFWLYMVVRFFESHWFVWCTQMSHIPNDIDYDPKTDWFTLQSNASCNVDPSPFNDWFSGHLNFQIEHHLFPTMPRHNYYKVTPMVKEICKKHGIEYRCKPLTTAFYDIFRTLKESGDLWKRTVQALEAM